MKRTVLFSLGLAVVIAIICQRDRATTAPLVFETAIDRAETDRSSFGPADAFADQLCLTSEGIPPDSLGGTLGVIRHKLRLLEDLPKADKEGEDELVRDLAGLLTDANAAEITRALSAREQQSRFGLISLQQWLKLDPLAASDWVATQPDASEEQAASVAQRLSEDRAALTLYCGRLPDSAWRELVLRQAALTAMRRDPIEALQLVEQINSGGAQLDLLQTTICTWMISSPTAAAAWIDQVHDPLVKDELVSGGAKTLAASDPLGAIDWLLSSLSVSSEGSELLLHETFQDIFTTWAERAPAQAASAVAQLPQGDIRETTVNAIWRSWLRRDPNAAVEWMKTLPERERIQAVAGIK